MNKKTYITPEMEIMNIETVDMMATSGDDQANIYDETTEDDARMGRGCRGAWGDLWNE